MNNTDILVALDSLALSERRETLLLARILEQADAERAALRTGRRKRYWVIAVAAALLVLAACTVAVYISTAAAAKADAAATAAMTDEEKQRRAGDAAAVLVDGAAPYVPVEGTASAGGVTIRLRGAELDDNGDGTVLLSLDWDTETAGGAPTVCRTLDDMPPDADACCVLGLDARDFVLTVGDRTYQPYRQPETGGEPQPAVWNGNEGMWLLDFEAVDASVALGAPMRLSGTLHRYSSDGTRTGQIGSFAIDFAYIYDEEARQARIDAQAQAELAALETDTAAREAALEPLPDEAVPLNIHEQDVTVLDAAVTEDGLLLGVRYAGYESPHDGVVVSSIQELQFYLDGYLIWWNAKDDRWSDGVSTCLLELPFYAEASGMPEESILYCTRPAGDNGRGWCAVDAVGIALRCNWKTGAIQRMSEAETAAYATEQRERLAARSMHRRYKADVQQTIQGVTVTVENVYYAPTGFFILDYRIHNVLCEIMDGQTQPAVTIAGKAASLPFRPDGEEYERTFDDRIERFKQTYDLKTPRKGRGQWVAAIPARIEAMPDTFAIVTDWTLYDLDAAGERVRVGDFHLEIPITRDDYTAVQAEHFLPGRQLGSYPVNP